MKTWEPEIAAAVVGLTTYELWQAWHNNAPTLAQVREASPNDIAIRQRLLDADITVGSLAILIGVTYGILTKDVTALIVLLCVFGALSFFHHWTLDAAAR